MVELKFYFIVIVMVIEVDQEHEYGRGGTNKYKSLSEFQDAINKARKENE